MSRRTRRPDARSEERATGRALRIAMTDVDKQRLARKLRRKAGLDAAEIAARVGITEAEAIAAIGGMRGRRMAPNHIALSVTRATGEFFRGLADPGEPTWQVMERVERIMRGYIADTGKRPRPGKDDRRGRDDRPDLFGGSP